MALGNVFFGEKLKYMGTSISPTNSHSKNYFTFINNPIMVLTLTASLNKRIKNKIIIKRLIF